MLADYSGRRFGVLGIGRSGIGAAGLIRRLGGSVLISDQKPGEHFAEKIDALTTNDIEVETGGHSRLLNEQFDTIVVSPGANLRPEWTSTWISRGTELWSELELASRCHEGRWIGVTGSNGKTTTVTLLTDMLRRGGFDTKAVGNIGQAWSEFLPTANQTVFVVEVSSFQMELTHTARPDVCVILNVLENHLDRHGDLETYGNLKLKLAERQGPSEHFVYNADDGFLSRRTPHLHSHLVSFGESPQSVIQVRNGKLLFIENGERQELLALHEWQLVGNHNLLNAAAAAAAARCTGVDFSFIRAALLEAHPVEHRIEFVREVGGVRYVNDSKSTNLTATLTALDAIDSSVILLYGGRPKQESFAPLRNLLGHRLKHLIVFGEAQDKVRAEVGLDQRVSYCKDLAESFLAARGFARRGETVLLSPGCASYDQYSNFEQRGSHFKKLVLEL